MDDNQTPPVLNYQTPPKPPPSPFVKAPSRAAWIAGALMLSNLMLVLICLALKNAGLWSVHMQTAEMLIGGVLFMTACLILTAVVFGAVLKTLLKSSVRSHRRQPHPPRKKHKFLHVLCALAPLRGIHLPHRANHGPVGRSVNVMSPFPAI